MLLVLDVATSLMASKNTNYKIHIYPPPNKLTKNCAGGPDAPVGRYCIDVVGAARCGGRPCCSAGYAAGAEP